MNALSELGRWLDEITEISNYVRQMGWWQDYESTTHKPYIAISVVGGLSPRELDTRQPQVSVTIVGAKGDNTIEIMELAEEIVFRTQYVQEFRELVNVQMMGEVIGPIRTSGMRPVVTMTLQLIM